MKAFNKVLQAIQNKPQNGHAIANAQNKVSLAKANKEIKTMMGSLK
jgi:hypothetical protein